MRFRVAVLYFILFLSGFAGLGYEIVWIRLFAVGLGHEIIAVLTVVSAFFCGVAAGSWYIESTWVQKWRPGYIYAVLEATIGLWSLALIILIPLSNRFMAYVMGPEPSTLLHWAVSFSFPFLLLLPATFSMGGTLPVMSHLLAFLGKTGKNVGGLYAANTFGAVTGTLLSVFFIIPHLGYSATLLFFVFINLFCTGGAILIAGSHQVLPINDTDRAKPLASCSPRRLFTALFVTGFLGIGYEVLVVRLMSQVTEGTVYSFAAALTVYLFGTACGGALYQRVMPKKGFNDVLNLLLVTLASFCLLTIPVLRASNHIYLYAHQLFGPGMTGSILSEMALAIIVFLLPTVAMGAIFSHLAQTADQVGGGLGTALSINTLGASFSALAFGLIILPLLGAKIALVLVALGYIFLIPVAGKWRYTPALFPLSAGIIIILLPTPLMIVTLSSGDEIVEHREGVMATVTIIQDRQREVHLKVNNRFQMGGTSSVFSDRRQGHIPLLLHPGPRTALFLGMGTGATLAAAKEYPGLHAEGVELIPEVIPLLHHFKKSTGDLPSHPQLHIVSADARRYVSGSSKYYDVIVADLFHPARDGSGSLYTFEHFAAINSRLTNGGLFCQWLPLYQLDLETLRIVTRTFLAVFPEGTAFLAHYSLKAPIIGLVATKGSRTYQTDWFRSRVRDVALAQKLREIRINDEFGLFGCFLAGTGDLRKFAGEGPLNTDDLPLVTFKAPRFAYSNPEPAYRQLFLLLDLFQPTTSLVLGPARNMIEADIHRRLASYWSARDRFLRTGAEFKETTDGLQLALQIKEPLLAIARQSRDFDPAYSPLLAMANRLHRADPKAAEQLLLDLERANPFRDDARSLRMQLRSRPEG